MRGKGTAGEGYCIRIRRTSRLWRTNNKKKLVEVAVTLKAYLAELTQVDRERKNLGKKPFERDDDAHRGGVEARSGCRHDGSWRAASKAGRGKPKGFYYSEHRTVDSKRNVIVNVHVEPANINDVTSCLRSFDEIETGLGRLPVHGTGRGHHNAGSRIRWRGNSHKVIGYRRHTQRRTLREGTASATTRPHNTSVLRSNDSYGRTRPGKDTGNTVGESKICKVQGEERMLWGEAV